MLTKFASSVLHQTAKPAKMTKKLAKNVQKGKFFSQLPTRLSAFLEAITHPSILVSMWRLKQFQSTILL
jgi:hypothetical protein